MGLDEEYVILYLGGAFRNILSYHAVMSYASLSLSYIIFCFDDILGTSVLAEQGAAKVNIESTRE